MSGPIKVLLVDDSDLVVGMVGQALEGAGMTVVRGANGAEGVELAYKEIPDVIVMDAEMPLMKGYVACRVLKSCRGVRDIPLIMHTSLSEDRDKYWARASGADAFEVKDFDRIDHLVATVTELAASSQANRELIREDGERVDADRVFELLGTVLDQQLFQSTLNNLLAQVGRSMDSLAETCRQILSLVPMVCESQLSVLLLQYEKVPVAYVLPSGGIGKQTQEDFLRVCQGEFFRQLPNADLDRLQEQVFVDGIPTPSQNEKRKLVSFTSVPILGRGDAVLGTLNLGNFTNNYFSETIQSRVDLFTRSVGPILDNAILFNQTTEMQDRIRTAFAKFIPQQIIDQLIESSHADVRLAGETREVTVLFADIRDFTMISENNSAEQIVAFLNRYFDIMVEVIKKHGGTIDKFIGDAILAIFGAPASYVDNALRATQAALEMRGALGRIAVDSLQLPEAGLRIGIGLHEGEVVVGNIGARDQFNYTVIGDTVNLASRIEGLTKYYQQSIIVSETVKERIDAEVLTRELDTVKVKGKGNSTRLFAVYAPQELPDQQFLADFSKGLSMYRMGNWEMAVDYLRRALVTDPTDRTAQLLLERCLSYAAEPPKNWDGAEIMASK